MYLSTIRRPKPDAGTGEAGRRRWGAVGTNVFALGTVSLVTDISSEMVTAILPLYLVIGLQLSPAAYGVVDGAYTGATVLLRLVGGYLADRVRRRKAVAGVGYGLSAIAKLGLLAAGGSVGRDRPGDHRGPRGQGPAHRAPRRADHPVHPARAAGPGFRGAPDDGQRGRVPRPAGRAGRARGGRPGASTRCSSPASASRRSGVVILVLFVRDHRGPAAPGGSGLAAPGRGPAADRGRDGGCCSPPACSGWPPSATASSISLLRTGRTWPSSGSRCWPSAPAWRICCSPPRSARWPTASAGCRCSLGGYGALIWCIWRSSARSAGGRSSSRCSRLYGVVLRRDRRGADGAGGAAHARTAAHDRARAGADRPGAVLRRLLGPLRCRLAVLGSRRRVRARRTRRGHRDHRDGGPAVRRRPADRRRGGDVDERG